MTTCSIFFQDMLKFITRTGVLILTSAIAIPYAVAFIVNLTHGWPIEEKKYKRAFHPKKVCTQILD